MERVTTGLPELDSLIGPIEKGSLILVESVEEAYPTLLLHVIAFNIALQGWKVKYVMVDDIPEDYEEAMSTVGLSLKPLISSDKWQYEVFEEVGEAWKHTVSSSSEGHIVILDSQKAPKVTSRDLEVIRSKGGIVILKVEPSLSEINDLKRLERLSHLLIRLNVEKTGRNTNRILEVVRFKRRPRRDVYLSYIVSESGISVEKLRRII